jgi:hypothetical protein
MKPPTSTLMVNHQRILRALRRMMVHVRAAQLGDARAALALGRDLTRLMGGLKREEALAPPRALGVVLRARETVRHLAISLAYAFSVVSVLSCVETVLGVLDDVDGALRAPASFAA